MSWNVQGDRVAAVREWEEEKTQGGLLIPERSRRQKPHAKVVAVGPDANKVKVGQSIIYPSYAVAKYAIDDVELEVVKEKDIVWVGDSE